MSYRDNPRTDKPRNGMLTEDQRKFLRREGKGYTEQNRRDYRRSIRDRIYNSVLDFRLLFDHWLDEEREEVFSELKQSEEGGEGLATMIAIFYLETRFTGEFNNLFGRGIRYAEDYMAGDSGTYQVTVKPVNEFVERVSIADAERAIEKFDKHGIRDLTEGEMRALLRLFAYQGYTKDDWMGLREKQSEELDKLMEEMREDVETRQKNAREK